MDRTRCWLWLTQVFGVGNNKIWEYYKGFPNVETACRELYYNDGGDAKLSESELAAAKRIKPEAMSEIVRICHEKGWSIITIDDEGYPERLRYIYNPPTLLFVWGSLDGLDEELAITVVGARKASPYSIAVSEKICGDLASVGVTLVSGFAVGIDRTAHSAALKYRTKTIAVLGSAIDYDYPKNTMALKQKIAQNGAVVSEFFPGTRPNPGNFPQRNRILAALGNGTLVVEASPKSGSLITVERTLDVGNEVFCVPPANLFEERYSGVIKLIRDGARPVFSYTDVLYEYYARFSNKLNGIAPYETISSRMEDTIFAETKKDENKFFKPSFNIVPQEADTNRAEKIQTDGEEIYPDVIPPEFDSESESEIAAKPRLPDEEIIRRMTELMNDHDAHFDEISNVTELSSIELSVLLTEKEIEGLIRLEPNGLYKLLNKDK